MPDAKKPIGAEIIGEISEEVKKLIEIDLPSGTTDYSINYLL